MKVRRSSVQIFKLFPIILAIMLVWGLCAVLTISGALGETNRARTDLKMDLITRASWFRLPYPCEILE